jgi:hypothetical protein
MKILAALGVFLVFAPLAAAQTRWDWGTIKLDGPFIESQEGVVELVNRCESPQTIEVRIVARDPLITFTLFPNRRLSTDERGDRFRLEPPHFPNLRKPDLGRATMYVKVLPKSSEVIHAALFEREHPTTAARADAQKRSDVLRSVSDELGDVDVTYLGGENCETNLDQWIIVGRLAK